MRGLHVKNTVGTLGDWELVARIKDPDVKLQVEMNRRLKDTTKANTAELVSFRKSADAAARRSEDAAARAGASAARLERLTRWLIAFTVGLVVLTVAVVALTAVLAARG